MNKDILFKTNEFIFSYRVAGILIKDQKILLQKPKNDDGYSIPGGHVSFGEITSETLIREFREELNDFYMVDLCCDESLQTFYKKFDMLKSQAMICRNYKYQRGRDL